VRSQNALRKLIGRFLGPVLSLVFLTILFWLGFRTLGPRGTGLPPTKPISDFSHWIIPLLASSFAIGFAVMAIIQLFKPEVRAAFHRREIERWLGFRDVERFLDAVSLEGKAALLELPIEQLAAQIQAASDAAFTIRSPQSEMLLELFVYPYGIDVGPIGFADEPKQQGRLAYIIQRRLDDLQIQVRRRWRQLLRLMSASVALLLTSLMAGILGLWQNALFGTAFLVLLLSLVGAFFASVTRDMVAILERLRNP
jgi:hypothetical protein